MDYFYTTCLMLNKMTSMNDLKTRVISLACGKSEYQQKELEKAVHRGLVDEINECLVQGYSEMCAGGYREADEVAKNAKTIGPPNSPVWYEFVFKLIDKMFQSDEFTDEDAEDPTVYTTKGVMEFIVMDRAFELLYDKEE
jgi:hypothetical protein